MLTDAERISLIEQLALAVARHRIGDTEGWMSTEDIERGRPEGMKPDRSFVLKFLRAAAPLYPLPESKMIDLD